MVGHGWRPCGVAGRDFYSQQQAQVGYPVGVIRMGGTSGLRRIVAHFRPFLMPKQELDSGVDIQNLGRLAGLYRAFQ